MSFKNHFTKKKQTNAGSEDCCQSIHLAGTKKRQIKLNDSVELTSVDDATYSILSEKISKIKIPKIRNKQKIRKRKLSSYQSIKDEEKMKAMEFLLDKLCCSFMSKRAALADSPNLIKTTQRIAQLCRKYSLEVDSAIFSTDNLTKKKSQFSKKLKGSPIQKRKNNEWRKSVPKQFVLYIDNLPPKATEEEVQNHFSQAGHVDFLSIPCPKGNCTLGVKSKDTFHKALELNHTFIRGNEISVVYKTKETELKRSLFVGHLPWDATSASIKAHFNEGGAGVEVTKLGPTGFCHLKVKDDEAYNKALEMNRTIINGKKIKVERLYSQLELKDSKTYTFFHNVDKKYVVFVGHLPQGTSREHILEHFSQVGSVSVISDPGPRGFCLLDTKNEETYLKALSMNQSTMQDEEITVQKLGGKLNVHKSKVDVVTLPPKDRKYVFFVTDLRWDTTREDIFQHFSQVGKVAIVSNLGHKGYCLLNAKNEETYHKALVMDQTFMDKQKIKVGRALGSQLTSS